MYSRKFQISDAPPEVSEVYKEEAFKETSPSKQLPCPLLQRRGKKQLDD
jgi:hypothetical protein